MVRGRRVRGRRKLGKRKEEKVEPGEGRGEGDKGRTAAGAPRAPMRRAAAAGTRRPRKAVWRGGAGASGRVEVGAEGRSRGEKGAEAQGPGGFTDVALGDGVGRGGEGWRGARAGSHLRPQRRAAPHRIPPPPAESSPTYWYFLLACS